MTTTITRDEIDDEIHDEIRAEVHADENATYAAARERQEVGHLGTRGGIEGDASL